MTDIVRRAFVLHSGGLDSSTVLAMAYDQCDFTESTSVVSISIDYGQRHIRETEYAEKLCDMYDIPHHVVEMAPPPKSMLTDPDSEIPDVGYDDLPLGISPTYVPFRNGQMLSRVAGIAQGWIMEQDECLLDEQREATIWFGAHAEDAQNWAYPDCTPEFVGSMAAAILVGTYNKVRLVTPFIHMTKAQIIEVGTRLMVPYELTWSCYKGEEKHCGTCPTCRARKSAFAEARVEDPTEYQP